MTLSLATVLNGLGNLGEPYTIRLIDNAIQYALYTVYTQNNSITLQERRNWYDKPGNYRTKVSCPLEPTSISYTVSCN